MISIPNHQLKVLVTGANGFLGRYVVAALCEAGHTVHALVRASADLPPFHWNQNVKVFRTNLLETSNLRANCAEVDAVIHLAADMKGSDEQQIAVAVDGTRNLLESINTGTRFILASSFSVYDWSRVGPVLTENSPLLDEITMQIHDGYTRAKVLQERLTRTLCHEHGIPLVILRPATIWGLENLCPSTIGPRGGSLCFVVNPRRCLRLTYVENCASAFVAALNSNVREKIFNIDDAFDTNAWNFTGSIAGKIKPPFQRIPIPYAVAIELSKIGSVLARPMLRYRKIPGLLIPQRVHARFNATEAGHTTIQSSLGWSPPFQLDECLARIEAIAAS